MQPKVRRHRRIYGRISLSDPWNKLCWDLLDEGRSYAYISQKTYLTYYQITYRVKKWNKKVSYYRNGTGQSKAASRRMKRLILLEERIEKMVMGSKRIVVSL
jgi:hypothetical protein